METNRIVNRPENVYKEDNAKLCTAHPRRFCQPKDGEPCSAMMPTKKDYVWWLSMKLTAFLTGKLSLLGSAFHML